MRKQKTTKPPRKSASPRKRKPSKQASPHESRLAHPPPLDNNDQRKAASSVTVSNEAEALFYFARIDERLADAWKRDVVVPKGPITIHRVIGTFFDSTHYAYVDRTLIWYLKHDPSDPLGAKWEGYLKTAGDAPRGTVAVFVGLDIMAKKSPPQITSGDS